MSVLSQITDSLATIITSAGSALHGGPVYNPNQGAQDALVIRAQADAQAAAQQAATDKSKQTLITIGIVIGVLVLLGVLGYIGWKIYKGSSK